MNVEYLEEMRDTFTRNARLLNDGFRKAVHGEATSKLFHYLGRIDSATGIETFKAIKQLHDDALAEMTKASLPKINEEYPYKPFYDQASSLFKSFVDDPAKLTKGLQLFDHFWESPTFNINSTDHLRRWLFDVKGFKPLKTTKKDGIQMAWDRVTAMPPAKQAEYVPAADKTTLKLYADQDKLVAQVQELKAVGNIVKAYMRGPDENGRERGIAKWIQQDDRIHANFSLTETDRPRCVHADTIIPCRSGNKRIADIVPGDEVWTHRNRWRKVVECYVLPPEPMFELTFSNGQVLKATQAHEAKPLLISSILSSRRFRDEFSNNWWVDNEFQVGVSACTRQIEIKDTPFVTALARRYDCLTGQFRRADDKVRESL